MKIKVNGKTIDVKGTNISIVNDEVIVNGKRVVGKARGVVEVIVDGDLINLTTDASVKCGNVKGNVDAGGSVVCQNVDGDIDAGGSVTSGKVGGNIDAGGSVVVS